MITSAHLDDRGHLGHVAVPGGAALALEAIEHGVKHGGRAALASQPAAIKLTRTTPHTRRLRDLTTTLALLSQVQGEGERDKAMNSSQP